MASLPPATGSAVAGYFLLTLPGGICWAGEIYTDDETARPLGAETADLGRGTEPPNLFRRSPNSD